MKAFGEGSEMNREEQEQLIKALHKAIDTVAVGHRTGEVIAALANLIGYAAGSTFQGSEEELVHALCNLNLIMATAAVERLKGRIKRN
jgi:hypothetical protein